MAENIRLNIEPQTCKMGGEEHLDNIEGKYIAQEKFDGHRAIMYCKGGKNHFYSRRTSDVTGDKEENTDRIPYLRDLDLSKFEDSIFDGELVADWEHTDSSIVQQVLGSTTERALELYKQGHTLTYKIFDVIKFRGMDFSKKPLYVRLNILNYVKERLGMYVEHVEVVPVVADKNVDKNLLDEFIKCPNYKSFLNDMLCNGSEGIILKNLFSEYTFKRSSDWLKYKSVKTADLVIMGFVSPKKDYTGKFSVEELKERGWEYWENDIPVSKTYAKGWVAGVKLGAFKDGKLKYVTTVKGFSDEVQENLKNNDLSNVVVEVEYQGIVNQEKKSLRHPRWKCFRFDKEYTECLWDNVGNS